VDGGSYDDIGVLDHSTNGIGVWGSLR